MALSEAGVIFVTEGYNDFLRKIGNASEAIAEAAASIAMLGRMTKNRLEAISELKEMLAILGNTSKDMSDDMVELAKSQASSTSESDRQNDSLKNLARDAFGGLTNAMKKSRGEANSYGDTIFSLGKAFDEAKRGFGKFTIAFGAIGNILGGIFGAISAAGLVLTPIPIVDELIALFGGPLAGTIIGAVAGLAVDVGVAIGDFAASVISQLSQVLPKIVQKIYDFVAPIVKAFFDIGKKIISAVGNAINTIFNGVRNIISTLSGGLLGGAGGGSLGDSLFGAMFKFEILKQTIRKIISEFKGFINIAYDAGVILQTLTIRLDNLIARQMRNIGLASDFSSSIQMASGYTSELLGWIKELSIATPFSLDTISDTVSLSMAMGWSIDSTKELTTAILDYSAAQGLSSDIMDRIIYNFAQMRQAGKVTGTELRDLARGAFMPVNDVLNEAAKMLGIAADNMQEFREAAASGAIDVETFFQAFINLANREFPNAARNMNFTMAAAIDNIKDLFRSLLGWNIVKPVLDAIATRIQRIIDSFNTPEVDRATRLLGMTFKYMAESLMQTAKTISWTFKQMFEALGIGAPSLDNVIKSMIKLAAVIQKIALLVQSFIYGKILPVFRDLRDEIDAEMDDTSDDAFTWGFNLIIEFGKGIMKGISTFLTKVMNALAGFLTGWLRPQSPPRIAPDIDLWGLGTIAEWLRGFTEADFSVLDSLKDSLKGSLGALVDLGVIDEEISANMYVSISADLVGAIEQFNETGEMTSVIYEQLRTVSGVFGEELVTLLDLQIQLAEATERVAVAQEAYNAAVEATKESTRLVNTSIKAYNALLRAGTDRSILDQRLAEINAAEMQLALDREMEAAAEEELQAAEDALDPIKEMVALQEQLIQQLIDLAEAQADAANAAAAGGGGGGGDEDQPASPESPIGFGELAGTEDLAAYFENLKEIALAELDVLWRSLREQWSTSFQENFGEGSAFQQSWHGFVDALALYWDTNLVSALGLPEWSEIAAIWEGVTIEDIFPFLRDEAAPIEWWQYTEGSADPTATSQDPGGLSNSLINLSGIVGKILETWNLFIGSVFGKSEKEGEPTFIQEIVAGIRGLSSSLESGELHTRIVEAGKALGEGMVDGIVEGIRSRLRQKTTEILVSIFGVFITDVMGLFGIASPSTVFEEIGKSLIDGLFQGISGSIVSAWSTVEAALSGFVGSVLSFFGIEKGDKSGGGASSLFLGIGESLIAGLVDGFESAVTSIIGVGGIVATKINDIIDAVKEALGIAGDGESSIFSSIGTSVIDGLESGMEDAFGSIETFLRDLIAQLPEWAKKWLGISSPSEVFMEIGEDTIAGLGAGLGAAASNFIDAASPSRLFSTIGRNTMLGMAQGILSASDVVYDAMSKVVNSSAIAPAMNMQATMQAPPVSSQAPISFGDVTINNSMDWAVFKAQVQRAILES